MISFLWKFVTVWNNLRAAVFSWMVSGLFAEWGRGSRVLPPFRSANLNYIYVGRNVSIERDCWILVTGDNLREGAPRLEIGSGTVIGMGATISAAQSVILEYDVLLDRNVYVSDHGHAYEDITRPIMDQGISKPVPVRIGHHSYLGPNVVVLPGVTIGAHCVVGANSVVKQSIPDFSVVAGVPAQAVKSYDKKSNQWKESSDR